MIVLDHSTATPTATPPVPSATVITQTPTTTKTSLPTSTLPPSFSSTITPSPLIESFTVHFHPDDMLYVGDMVSIEVISPDGMDVTDGNLRVQIDPPYGETLGPVNFGPWGIQGRDQATLLWLWDTRNLNPGIHSLAFIVQPGEIGWTEQVTLLPSSEMPHYQADATWVGIQSQCCAVFYITNTASERDISTLTSMMDEQASLSSEKMGTDFTQPITVTLIPRLLGHGGFASNDISVSYLDRNYAANSWELVVHHEMIHTLDGQLGGDFRPTIFIEGLAVYLSGGHYKLEPFMPRAASLLESYLGWYIPLEILANDFYSSQHEIGYLEAAALVEYMVTTFGWEAFSSFYRDILLEQNESQSEAIDTALRAHFSTSLARLEQDFLAALKLEPDTSAWVEDVRLTVTYFDTLRRYQQLLDPSAYFRTAWLMDNQTMRERNIVADYLRHPQASQNLALETLFITARQQMEEGDGPDAFKTLEVINTILNSIENSNYDPFSTSPMAADYFSISASLLDQGFEIQSISIAGDNAIAYAAGSLGPELIELHLTRQDGEWMVTP